MKNQKKEPRPGMDGAVSSSWEPLTPIINNIHTRRAARKTVQPAHHFNQDEKRQIIQAASSQEDAIRLYFRQHPGRKHHYAEVMEIFGYRESSAKRAMANLSNSKPDGPWVDQNGEPPLLRLDEKRLNMDTGIRIGLYRWNPRYGRRKETQQTELFEGEGCRV